MASESDRPSSLRGTSMFERRMLIVGIVFAVVLGGMAARLFSLTVVMGSQQRALADSRLDRSTLLATVRGSITDRKGRVLAESVPSYDVAIFYPAINGAWVDTRAIAAAKRAVGRAAWNRLGPAEREERIQTQRQGLAAELELVLNEVAKACHMTRDDLSAEMGSVRMHVEKKASAVWEARLEIDRAKYGEDAEGQFDAQPIAEQSEAHVVKSGIETASVFVLRKLADAHPGTIEVQDSTRRVYPWASKQIKLDRSMMPGPLRGGTLELDVQGIADHVIGGVRDEVWREDLDRRPFRTIGSAGDVKVDLGGYRPGRDMVGSYGIERNYEDLLRGKRGRTTQRVDTNETTRTEPVLGSDLQLTLDIELQARVQALFMPKVGLALVQQWHYGWDKDGTPKGLPFPKLAELNGAAVVLDVGTGEILSMVSWPTVAAGEHFDDAVRTARVPSMNRAIEGSYEPGSIIKPIVYVSAVRSGVFGAEEKIECNGRFFDEGEQVGRCWIYTKPNNYQTHSKAISGPLGVEAAISHSCNIYFETIAERMGLRTLTDWYRNFGLGQKLDIGIAPWEPRLDEAGSIIGYRLSGEHPGSLPSEQAITKIQSTNNRIVPAIAGIGQGPILLTPMQAANAYATLARRGVIRDAELLVTPIPRLVARRTDDLKLDPHSWELAFEGLRQSVEEHHGTGNHVSFEYRKPELIINAPGVRVWAKTGTAQTSPLRVDDDGNGTIDRTIPGLNHAWFVALVGDAQEHSPRYAVAVLLEHGGSGGKSAGPIANQVIHALIAEGYLQGDPHSRPARQPLQRIGATAIEPTGGAG